MKKNTKLNFEGKVIEVMEDQWLIKFKSKDGKAQCWLDSQALIKGPKNPRTTEEALLDVKEVSLGTKLPGNIWELNARALAEEVYRLRKEKKS